MKIPYVETKDGKLFSFYRYDYKEYIDNEGKHTFIDGGTDYIRTNSEIKYDTVDNLIEDIRKQFTWISIYNKENKLLKEPIKRILKDMDTDHIEDIINKLPNIHPLYIVILKAEIKYRNKRI